MNQNDLFLSNNLSGWLFVEERLPSATKSSSTAQRLYVRIRGNEFCWFRNKEDSEPERRELLDRQTAVQVKKSGSELDPNAWRTASGSLSSVNSSTTGALPGGVLWTFIIEDTRWPAIVRLKCQGARVARFWLAAFKYSGARVSGFVDGGLAQSSSGSRTRRVVARRRGEHSSSNATAASAPGSSTSRSARSAATSQSGRGYAARSVGSGARRRVASDRQPLLSTASNSSQTAQRTTRRKKRRNVRAVQQEQHPTELNHVLEGDDDSESGVPLPFGAFVSAIPLPSRSGSFFTLRSTVAYRFLLVGLFFGTTSLLWPLAQLSLGTSTLSLVISSASVLFVQFLGIYLFALVYFCSRNSSQRQGARYVKLEEDASSDGSSLFPRDVPACHELLLDSLRDSALLFTLCAIAFAATNALQRYKPFASISTDNQMLIYGGAGFLFSVLLALCLGCSARNSSVCGRVPSRNVQSWSGGEEETGEEEEEEEELQDDGAADVEREQLQALSDALQEAESLVALEHELDEAVVVDDETDGVAAVHVPQFSSFARDSELGKIASELRALSK